MYQVLTLIKKIITYRAKDADQATGGCYGRMDKVRDEVSQSYDRHFFLCLITHF